MIKMSHVRVRFLIVFQVSVASVSASADEVAKWSRQELTKLICSSPSVAQCNTCNSTDGLCSVCCEGRLLGEQNWPVGFDGSSYTWLQVDDPGTMKIESEEYLEEIFVPFELDNDGGIVSATPVRTPCPERPLDEAKCWPVVGIIPEPFGAYGQNKPALDGSPVGEVEQKFGIYFYALPESLESYQGWTVDNVEDGYRIQYGPLPGTIIGGLPMLPGR